MSRESRRTVASIGRCLAVWAIVTSATALVASLSLGPLLALPRARADFAALLTGSAAAAALVASSWLWVVSSAVLLDAARGVRPRSGACPAVVRRMLLAACGVTLVGGLAAPAGAAQDLARLPLPDRAESTAAHRPMGPPPVPTASDPSYDVLVRPGDTLWALAERHLPPDASSAEIAGYVARLHTANRLRIGADPDLIHPGTRLRLPHSTER